MTDAGLVLLSISIAALALVVTVIAILSSRRSAEQQMERADHAAAAAEQRAVELQEQVDFLRQLDSVRVTERYLSTKSGIEQRTGRLETEISARRERAMQIRSELEAFLTDQDGGGVHLVQLRRDLARNLEEARRLESAVESVSRIGALPLDSLRSEIARRRQNASELRQRVERAELQGEARAAEVSRLQAEAAAVEEEERRLRRELEVTHLLAPAIDSLLGVTPDLEDRAAKVQAQLRTSFSDVAPGEDPLGDFLRVLRGEARAGGRLLTAGEAPPPAATEPPPPAPDAFEPTDENGASAPAAAPAPPESVPGPFIPPPLAGLRRTPAERPGRTEDSPTGDRA